MSTRSTIKIKRKDNTETGIYCHFDGYIQGVGTTLQLAYNTADKVEKLLALGDLSQIGYYTDPDPEKEHSFDGEHQPNVCVAYHRDRGEEFMQSNSGEEYIYTFDEREAVWYVEEEEAVEKTMAQTVLELDGFWRRKKRLLLDAIMESDYTGWTDDDFAKSGEVEDQCIKKAKEAREEIVKRQHEEYEEWYRTYCD